MSQYNPNPYGVNSNSQPPDFGASNSVGQYTAAPPTWNQQPIQVFSEGKLLIVRNGTVLPPRCVKTNEPITNDQYKRATLVYCPPIVFLFLFCGGLIPLLIAYLVMRKRCHLSYGLTPEISSRYFRFNSICILVGFASLFGCVFAAINEQGLVAAVSMFTFLITLICALAGKNILTAVNHKDDYFKIKGCCPDFIEQTLREQYEVQQKQLPNMTGGYSQTIPPQKEINY